LLWRFDLDDDGSSRATTLRRAVVRSREALAYPPVQQALDRGTASEAMTLLREVGRLRQRLEEQRGGVDLDLPTQAVVHRDGRYQLEYRCALPVEGWNAQVSLLTGMEAARLMLDGTVGVLRTMPRPDRRVVAAIRRSAKTLGVPWPDGAPSAAVVRSVDRNTAEGAALVTQAARALRGAGYYAFDGTAPTGDKRRHSAVAAPYAHVTAPLRRLVDRFANEVVLALAADDEPPEWARSALRELPKLMGAARERERTLNRAIVDYVEAMVLRHRVGEVFPVVVTDLDDRRAVIQLRDPAVLARLDPAGRTLGEELDVRLVSTDPQTRQVTFEPV
jgi:exoribonuclease R